MKPTTPMRGHRGPKQAQPRPQRRHRFHEPHQPHLQRRCRFHEPRQPRPQRRRGFHEQPKNTTGSTTARPHRDAHETHDTNARPQPPKTGPTTPAKATPVSRASRLHCHRELSAARSHRSLTGSLAPICESQSMFHARFTLINPSGHEHHRHHPTHDHTDQHTTHAGGTRKHDDVRDRI